MVYNFLYYISIFTIVYYGLVDKFCIETFLDITLSPFLFGLISLMGIVSGYFFAKKWWKIIYIDGVYHFHKHHKK